jgi:nicotinamidase-related amidase
MEKHHGSAFQDTVLTDWLLAHGIITLVVCGLTTHGCVKATCKDALKSGFRVILASDGHSSYHPKAAALIEEWNMKLGRQGVVVAPAEKIFFYAGNTE